MMAVILNSVILDSDTAILDSDTWLSSLRFTQKHSSSTLTLTDTNSIWLKLIHSYSTWWWWPSWILPSWIQLLASWIQTSCFLLSDSLKNTLTPLWLWLKLIQSDSNSFILTQLNDGGHLEFGHLGFRNLSFSSQTHSHLPRLVPTICTKILHSFILTDLDDGSYLEFCHVWFRPWHVAFKHLVIFSQLHSKTLSLHSDSDSN